MAVNRKMTVKVIRLITGELFIGELLGVEEIIGMIVVGIAVVVVDESEEIVTSVEMVVTVMLSVSVVEERVDIISVVDSIVDQVTTTWSSSQLLDGEDSCSQIKFQ